MHFLDVTQGSEKMWRALEKPEVPINVCEDKGKMQELVSDKTEPLNRKNTNKSSLVCTTQIHN